jgi:S1-C subfamily serine protease
LKLSIIISSLAITIARYYYNPLLKGIYVKRLIILFWAIFFVITSIGCCSHGIFSAANDIDQYQTKSLITHLNKSTVAILDGSVYDIEVMCTGIWVNQSYFVTAKHCVTDEIDDEIAPMGKLIPFKTFNEAHLNIPEPMQDLDDVSFGMVAGFNLESDLALVLSIDENLKHDYVSIYEDEIFQGQQVHIVGHPMGVEYSYVPGTVSQVRMWKTSLEEQKVVHITALTFAGNSGSGVVNNDGELLAIISFSFRRIPGMKFGIHRDEIIKLLKDNHIEY